MPTILRSDESEYSKNFLSSPPEVRSSPSRGNSSQMRTSNEYDHRSTASHVTIDDEPSREILTNTPHHQPQPTPQTAPTAKLPPDVSPKSHSSGYEEDSRSLTHRYQKALGLGDTTLSSSTRTTKSQNLQSRQKIVGVGAEVFSSTDDDEFDWDDSGESELDETEREERQKRKLHAHHTHLEHENHLRRAKRLRKVYLSLMRLSRPIRTAIILILGCSITITPAIVAILRFPGHPAKMHILIWSIWTSINIAVSCIIFVLVDIFPVIAIKLSCLLYGSAPEKLKTQVELWMGVRTWTKIALSLTSYWATLLVMFLPVFPFRNDPQLDYFHWIKRVTGALFGTGLVLLAEKILLQIVKINFHRTSLQDRLEENDKALRALDKLAAAKDAAKMHKKSSHFAFGHFTPVPRSGRNTPARMHGTQTPLQERKSHKTHGSTVVNVPMASMVPHTNSSGLGVPEGVSAAELTSELQAEALKKKKRPVNLSSMTDQITQVIAQATLKDGMRNADASLDAATHSAKKLARKLFEGLDEDKGGVLTRDEFEPYFKNPADAAEAFKVFDKDGNGDIDRKEMRNAVSRIYRERRALATSLKDMSSAVSKLDGVLVVLALLVSIFIWLFVFNPKGTTSQLVPMATIILGFSFVFGNAAKNLFESMLFIFSIHPYDVGDLIFIDDSPMFVLEFGLFSTTFQRCDGQVIVAPNSVLFGKKYILNVRRSGPMWEATKVMVSFDTPLEILHEFRTRLRQFVSDHPREWKGGLDVNIDFMQNQNLIQLAVAMEHKSNWQDWGARWDRRTLLMKEMKRIMDQLNMTYKLPLQPVSFNSRELISSKAGSRSHEPFLRSSQRSQPSMRASATSPNSTFLGNAARMGTNSQAPWNTGALPSLGIQTHRL
ncbi:hypothetical protein MJO28_002609 [Puccinia striiformis f. sp. tritici]|uniref:Uncharacterized protein n=1 Tax=Puccinia striiformis f. sp. tritici TaxID=168172 RepID=A0ACC0ERU6_9BASI|nr:hypothetical protein MJO28_002609 [Puccinia striiformis f. sp. tritici]